LYRTIKNIKIQKDKLVVIFYDRDEKTDYNMKKKTDNR